MDEIPAAERDDRKRSLLDDVGAEVCAVLGIQSLGHRSALIDLCRRDAVPPGAVRAAYDRIAANWDRCHAVTGGGASTKNWRWRFPQLAIAAHNRSPEVVLERALVGACERVGRDDWSNQVPVCSGIAGPSRERRRAIDLVHRVTEDHFEFIELKVASDTPLYAAFEIISSVCLWLLSRQRPRLPANPVLEARRVHAVVWAPEAFYAGHALAPLSAQLDSELAALGKEHFVELGFRFDSLPDALVDPPYTDAQVMALLEARRPL